MKRRFFRSSVTLGCAVPDSSAAPPAVGDIRPVIGRFGGDSDVVFQGDAEQVGGRFRSERGSG